MVFSIEQFSKFTNTLDNLKLGHTQNNKHKGIIFDNDNNLVMTNFPCTIEYVLPRDETKVYDVINDHYKCFISEEGTLIRVFYYNDKWYISTSSRLDAHKSFWSNPVSFGAQFENFLSIPIVDFLDKLDKSKQYIFLLPTIGYNRIGKMYDPEEKKTIFLVGTRDKETGIFKFGTEYSTESTESTNYWEYLKEINIRNIDDLRFYIDKEQNVLFYMGSEKIEDISLVKCVNSTYNQLCELRNNECNIEQKLLEILVKSPYQLKNFSQMYPELNIGYIVNRYNNMISFLHSQYIERYINKKFIELPKPIHYILKLCHERYKFDRQKTTKNVVTKLLSLQTPKFLMYLYSTYNDYNKCDE